MRIYIETYGCSLNQADTSIMKGILKLRGHEVVESIDDAEVVIINTCTVRLDTEERMKSRIRRIRKIALSRGLKMIVAGCMARAQPALVLSIAPESCLVSPSNIGMIAEVVESNRRMSILGDHDKPIELLEVDGVIATVPIAEGCLGQCSYCITKFARGKLKSYREERVINSIKKLVAKGAVEIRLTAQDAAVYGRDIRTNLPELVRKILEKVEGEYMIRIGMMNPGNLMGFLDDLIDVLKEERVFNFVHIPVQSGDNSVLKLMNRNYTVEDFEYIVKKIRRSLETVTIATDIIIGHPGETNEAFENTLRLMRELEFDRVHIAQYTVRPHTRSASMMQIPSKIKKERTIRAVRVAEELCLKRNKRFVGREVAVLLTEKNYNKTLTGRTISYHPVIVEGDGSLLGSWVKVKVNNVTFYDLRGTIVSRFPKHAIKCKPITIIR